MDDGVIRLWRQSPDQVTDRLYLVGVQIHGRVVVSLGKFEDGIEAGQELLARRMDGGQVLGETLKELRGRFLEPELGEPDNHSERRAEVMANAVSQLLIACRQRPRIEHVFD